MSAAEQLEPASDDESSPTADEIRRNLAPQKEKQAAAKRRRKDAAAAEKAGADGEDEDVEEAPRQGWISGPCDCFLTIWAGLGDAIEGGADQIVGLLLLILSGSFTYALTHEDGQTTGGDSYHRPDRAPPPAPPAQPDWPHIIVHVSASFAQLHPASFVISLLVGLVAVAWRGSNAERLSLITDATDITDPDP